MNKIWILILLFFHQLIPTLSFSFYLYPFDTPTYSLKELNTPNFRIIYSKSSISNAYEIASFIEEEFTSLTNYYGEFLLPKYIVNQKINIIVSSDYQIANGFASLFLYPTIHLYTKNPPLLSSSHSYTTPNHLRTLVRHELTHIITLAIRQYFPKNPMLNTINYLVNPVAIFSSRSFMEGVAIARESDFKYGRLNDPYLYHLARRDTLDNNIPSFAQFGGAHTGYNKGELPYIYGALFYKYLTQQISPTSDKKFWDNIGRWKITSWALNNTTKKSQKELWKGFTNFLTVTNSYATPENLLLKRNKDQRINSIQHINNKIYYFNTVNRELRAYNLTTKKDRHILYGKRTWNKVSLSDNEKYLLVSGFTEKKSYSIIISRKGLISKSLVFWGYDDASFLPNTSNNDNFSFTAINRNTTYPELVVYQNNQFSSLHKGSSNNYFDSPMAIDSQYIYFLHSYDGQRMVSRIDRNTLQVYGLKNTSLSFPRFLNKDKNSISISYAENSDSFYKRAIISNDTLILIRDNIKGEILNSVIDNDILYYRSAFSKQDNLVNIPLNQLTTSTQQTLFTTLNTIEPTIYTSQFPEQKYQISRDMTPLFWIPFVNLNKAGLQTILQDNTGANLLHIGINVEYQKGTPEFNFQWSNEELPITFKFHLYNIYRRKHNILQLPQHHLINIGFQTSYDIVLPNIGKLILSSGLHWQGSLIGNQQLHPYQWHDIAFQQVIHINTFSWQYHVSEGSYGFYRHFSITINNRMDYINSQWYRFEGILTFSPPVLPIKVDFIATYDTSSLSIYGLSILGTSSIPEYKEYTDHKIFNTLALFGNMNIMLYSWEIQNGLGFGEIFFNRWAFHTGYRAGYWGNDHPFLHSLYIKTQFDFSIGFGNIPISLILEGNYAITINKWGYDFKIHTSLSF